MACVDGFTMPILALLRVNHTLPSAPAVIDTADCQVTPGTAPAKVNSLAVLVASLKTPILATPTSVRNEKPISPLVSHAGTCFDDLARQVFLKNEHSSLVARLALASLGIPCLLWNDHSPALRLR